MVAASGAQAGADIQTFNASDHLSLTLACSTTTAVRTVQFPKLRTNAAPCVRLWNAGADTIFVRFGNDALLAATIPSGATPGDMGFAAGAIETFPVRLDENGQCQIAGICPASTATLHIAPGFGS